jgi:hypothetical protein
VPFLRFSRDKRGVESFALVHTTTNRRGKVRPRVLYWFRTPPDIKVGRQPFDPAVRRALEAQNPDITFDWRAIVETPIPSADADKWRERRRAERAAKSVVAAEESAETASGAIEIEADVDVDADADAGSEVEEIVAAPSEAAVIASDPAEPSTVTPPAQSAPRSNDPNRKRRRRRRSGGGGRGGNTPVDAAPSSPSGGEPSGE